MIFNANVALNRFSLDFRLSQISLYLQAATDGQITFQYIKFRNQWMFVITYENLPCLGYSKYEAAMIKVIK